MIKEDTVGRWVSHHIEGAHDPEEMFIVDRGANGAFS